jgi:flavodoxin
MVLIVYDSIYGNTLKIAELIRDMAIQEQLIVRLIHAEHLTQAQLREANLVFLGSPTRAFRPTPLLIRALKSVKNEWRNKDFVAFDTRMNVQTIDSKLLKTMIRWFGYAAQYLAKRLKRWGANERVEPLGFQVVTTTGPLDKEAMANARTAYQPLLEHFKNEQ